MPSQLALAFVLASPAAAFATDPLGNLPFNIAGGTPNLDVRLRYENVDQENLAKEANALTLRTRLGFTTGKWNDIDGQIEFEGITSPGSDHYNSTDNGQAAYPIVADPDGNEVNQAWIRYSGIPKTTIKYGRQRLIYDNQRFIGNSGWRQNEQTFDAVQFSTTYIPRVQFDYVYISNVNAFRFFDFDPSPTVVKNGDNLDVWAHYFRAAVNVVDKKLTVTPYALLIDFDEIPAPPLARQDTKTLGARASGALPAGKLTFSYALEYAKQKDYKQAPSTVDASYLLVEPAVAYGKFKATLGYEKLGGDGTYSFQTPFATLHSFQGWADQFLVTPATGIQDRYVSATGALGKAALTAVYHDYQSDKGSTDFGTEWDVLATYALIDNLTFGAKYAAYNADEFPTAGTPAKPFDTDKTWAWIEYKF